MIPTPRYLKSSFFTCLFGLLTGLSCFVSSVSAQCGGICLYEVGSMDMGISAAGASARAQDSATVYFNPAGMTRLESNEISIGLYGLYIDQSLSLNDNTIGNPPAATNPGGQIGGLIPGVANYSAIKASEDLAFGMAVNAPIGAGTDYNPNWAGRNFLIKNELFVFNIQPTVAYQVTETFSIGTGLNIYYADFSQDIAASNRPAAGLVSIDGDDWSVGATVGGLYEPQDGTRFGLVYRSKAEMNLSGSLRSNTPINLGFGFDFDLPQGINASVYHDIDEEWAILFDTGWSDWSDLGDQALSVQAIGPGVSNSIDRDWSDTWRVGIGTIYSPEGALSYTGGFSFDSAAVSSNRLLPDIPSGEQWRWSLGVIYALNQFTDLGLSYTLLWGGDMKVSNVPLGNSGVVLDGDYNNTFIHAAGLRMNVKF